MQLSIWWSLQVSTQCTHCLKCVLVINTSIIGVLVYICLCLCVLVCVCACMHVCLCVCLLLMWLDGIVVHACVASSHRQLFQYKTPSVCLPSAAAAATATATISTALANATARVMQFSRLQRLEIISITDLTPKYSSQHQAFPLVPSLAVWWGVHCLQGCLFKY